MAKYEVDWNKTYYAFGTNEVEAESVDEARIKALDMIGGWEGNMQYDPRQDDIEEITEVK